MTTHIRTPQRTDRPHVVDDWFMVLRPRPGARTRLFCFPHAGGDVSAFATLAGALPRDTEVWALRLPGRGARLHEPLPADFDTLVAQVTAALLPHTAGVDFGIYGQSFGGLLAYEVARALPAGHLPRFLVPASVKAPQVWAEQLPERLDAAGLLAATGFDTVLGQDPELAAMTLEVIGADLELCRTYRHRPGPLPAVAVLAVAGTGDPLVDADDLAAWAEVAGGTPAVALVEGGHVLASPATAGPLEPLRALAAAAPAPAPAAPATSPDLSDTLFWQGPDVAARVDALRSASPVCRTVVPGDGPVWSVLSYELAMQVLGDGATFSSTGGSLLGSSPGGAAPAGAGRMMAMCDGPAHRTFRHPVAPFFNTRSTAGYAPRLAQLTEDAVRRGLDGGEVNFVDLISPVPVAVMCDLLDIPVADRGRVVALSDAAFLGTTAHERQAGHQELIRYLFGHAVRHRARPGGGLAGTLATHTVDGARLPLEEVVLNLDNILVGGVQTVRHTAAMGMLALLRHPDQFAALWDGTVEMDDAVDELLRWTSSGLHVLRTAACETELGGIRVRAGEKVVVWTWAANHDPERFDRPAELLLDRSPNRHLGLGFGPHYCVGAALAKAELSAIFTTLRARARAIEPAGTPRHNTSIINFGLDDLPVRLVAR
ncbi:cytochrome P450 [Streptantibioticus silvisoli]|uniref:Cytochrome P450 n=1 Tax=Streptantibioticus silvisoli TaxID=2705255 RepID=A0ABT6W7H4_9ACTN|nr:cytochrome P450 [Streptantibioticus silvisoli]MDI5965436.1 cytochrome P450 [Streptantibioticus silvisoli]